MYSLLDLQLLSFQTLGGFVSGLLVFVVPVFEDEGDDGQCDTHEDDDEDTTDVVDGDSAAAVVFVLAINSFRVLIPPALLKGLQFTLVKQFQDAEKDIISNSV